MPIEITYSLVRSELNRSLESAGKKKIYLFKCIFSFHITPNDKNLDDFSFTKLSFFSKSYRKYILYFNFS